MRHSRPLVLAASIVSMLAIAGCSAGETSVGTPSAHRTTGSGSGNGTAGGDPSGTGGGNGATTPPAGGTTTPPAGGTTTPPTGGTPAPTDGSTISADETWSNGKQIAGSVVIAAGATVTIAPSAQIAIADGATITVKGALKGASSGAAHAKLTGSAWAGLVVASGGTLSLDGVDIDNAATGINTQSGNTAATFDNATMNAPTTPFKVDVGSKLSMTRSVIAATKGQSSVGGSFTASYLDYDSNGNEGISMTDPSAVFSADDSKFHGTSNTGGDMIVVNNAATIHLGHSEIQKCHCSFHFNGVTNYDISFMSLHDVSYGFMQYGSDTAAGKRTISDSNFVNLAAVGIDESGTNGPITATNVYFSNVAGGNVHLVDAEIKVATPVKNPVAGVGPRP